MVVRPGRLEVRPDSKLAYENQARDERAVLTEERPHGPGEDDERHAQKKGAHDDAPPEQGGLEADEERAGHTAQQKQHVERPRPMQFFAVGGVASLHYRVVPAAGLPQFLGPEQMHVTIRIL